jgi:hypothetical protein
MTPLTLPEWKTQGGPTAEQRRFKNTEIPKEMSTPVGLDSVTLLQNRKQVRPPALFLVCPWIYQVYQVSLALPITR